MPFSPRLSLSGALRALLLLSLLPAGVAPTPAQSDPYTAEFIQSARAANAAYEAKNWDEAAALFQKAAKSAPKEIAADCLYSYACCLALKGDHDDALAALHDSVQRGFADVELATKDPDLDALRSERAAQWKEVAARLESKRRELDETDPDGFIILPSTYDREKPLGAVVALHPFGGNPRYMIDLWTPVVDERGLALVVVRGGLAMGAGRYEWDMRRLDREIAKIERWTDKALFAHPNIDPKRLYLTGYSQGGAVAAWMALRAPDRWAGVIPVAAPSPTRAEFTIDTYPDHPTLIYSIIGTRDREEFVAFNKALKEAANGTTLRVELRLLPGVGHAPPPYVHRELKSALDWIEKERAALREAPAS